MRKLLKQITISTAITALVAMFGLTFTAPVASATGINDQICKGVAAADGGASTCTEDSTNSFAALAKKVVNIFSMVVGAVSVIMIIVGGFRYIVSNGDSTAVTGAKNSILYAIVGLVIVLFAQVIVRFVLTNAAS